MELSNEKIKSIIEHCANSNRTIRVRDIAYCLLCRYFEEEVAYTVVFFDNDYSNYSKDEKVSFLKKYLDSEMTRNSNTSNDDITFEENKAYMLKLKRETEEAIAQGELEKKDGLKILAQISTTLNDKFQVKEEAKDQIVIVNQKYDSVCEYCGHEVSSRPMSKEEAIKKYNLVEKTK